MIKITAYAFQGNAVKADIEFDLGANTYNKTVTVGIAQLVGMTVDQIKTWVKNFVANQRSELQKTQVGNLLDPLLNVDLET